MSYRRNNSMMSKKITIGLPMLILLGVIFFIASMVEVTGDVANGLTLGLVVPAQILSFFGGIGGNLAQAIIFTVVLGALGGSYSHHGSFKRDQYTKKESRFNSNTKPKYSNYGRKFQ